MISLDEVRKTLNMPDLTDEEILRVRNSLYELINRLLDEMYEKGQIPKDGTYVKNPEN